MTLFSHRIPRLAGILAIPLLLVATPALAQSPLSGGVLGPGSATAGAQPNAKPQQRRPAALPGTRTDRTEPAPADRLASEMAPTEALFDGINRGDMAAVKDAISRGAELNGRNILGLTPIDLSVDLGYSDISFLLLSLRGSGDKNGPPPAVGGKADLQALAKAEARSAQRSAQASAKAAKSAKVVVSPPPPASPKLFANDGGAPVPNAGFLGFGTQR